MGFFEIKGLFYLFQKPQTLAQGQEDNDSSEDKNILLLN